MAPKIDTIANVNTSRDDWSIIARVVRLWPVSVGKTSRTTSIELILVDEEGSLIQASVRQVYIRKFERILKEGCVYSFRGFSVSTEGGEYRSTKHECKMNIQGSTKVVLLADNAVPLPAYAFASFPEILDGLLDTSYLIDVLGVLTSVGEERSINRIAGPTKMNVIELENTGVKITCSLWGSYVDQLNKFTATAATDTAIVALFGVKIKQFQGKTTLQNTMHSTKLVFNPQFPQAIELRRCAHVTFTQGANHLTSSGIPSLEDDFLTLTEGKSIAQLLDLPNDIPGCYIVLGTIQNVAEPLDWWYLACKCHRAVRQGTSGYYCNFCDRRVSHVTPRYKLKVNVVDETGSTTFVIFDRSASILFGKECSDMLDAFEKDDNGSDCPDAISELVGKEFLFKVEVKGHASPNFETTYIVKRLTDATAIMHKFREINGIGNVGHSSPSVTPSKESPHATTSTMIPKVLVSELEGSSKTACQESVVDNDVEPLLLLSPVEGAGSPTGQNQLDDLAYLNKKKIAAKQIASEDGETLRGNLNPKLIKRIKIEKP